MLLIISI
ncbi:hypothetical protein CISIN_1g0041462mg, partial [Citrus sinensis]